MSSETNVSFSICGAKVIVSFDVRIIGIGTIVFICDGSTTLHEV